jgi:hypothetical protein
MRSFLSLRRRVLAIVPPIIGRNLPTLSSIIMMSNDRHDKIRAARLLCIISCPQMESLVTLEAGVPEASKERIEAVTFVSSVRDAKNKIRCHGDEPRSRDRYHPRQTHGPDHVPIHASPAGSQASSGHSTGTDFRDRYRQARV